MASIYDLTAYGLANRDLVNKIVLYAGIVTLILFVVLKFIVERRLPAAR